MAQFEEIDDFRFVVYRDCYDQQIIKRADMPTIHDRPKDEPLRSSLIVDKDTRLKVYADTEGWEWIRVFSSVRQYQVGDKYLFLSVDFESNPYETMDRKIHPLPFPWFETVFQDYNFVLYDQNFGLLERFYFQRSYDAGYWHWKLGGAVPKWWASSYEYVRHIHVDGDQLILPRSNKAPLAVSILDEPKGKWVREWSREKRKKRFRRLNYLRFSRASTKWSQFGPRTDVRMPEADYITLMCKP